MLWCTIQLQIRFQRANRWNVTTSYCLKTYCHGFRHLHGNDVCGRFRWRSYFVMSFYWNLKWWNQESARSQWKRREWRRRRSNQSNNYQVETDLTWDFKVLSVITGLPCWNDPLDELSRRRWNERSVESARKKHGAKSSRERIIVLCLFYHRVNYDLLNVTSDHKRLQMLESAEMKDKLIHSPGLHHFFHKSNCDRCDPYCNHDINCDYLLVVCWWGLCRSKKVLC